MLLQEFLQGFLQKFIKELEIHGFFLELFKSFLYEFIQILLQNALLLILITLRILTEIPSVTTLRSSEDTINEFPQEFHHIFIEQLLKVLEIISKKKFQTFLSYVCFRKSSSNFFMNNFTVFPRNSFDIFFQFFSDIFKLLPRNIQEFKIFSHLFL